MKTRRIEVRRTWGLCNCFYCTQPFAMLVLYEVCLKSNETGAINFFINNRTTNEHNPLQSSSLGKPHRRRRCSYSRQQRWKSSCGSAVSWSVTTFWVLSTVPKWRPLMWNLSFRKRKKSILHGPAKTCWSPVSLKHRPYCQRKFFTAVASKTECLQTSIDVNFFLVLVWGTRPWSLSKYCRFMFYTYKHKYMFRDSAT